MINDIISRQVIGQPTPVIGMGATTLIGSDRYAATIVEVIDKKNGTYIIGVQDDNAQFVSGDGGTGNEVYEYTPNTNGRITYFRAKKDSKWREVAQNSETGRWGLVPSSYGLAIGYRDQYRDPSF